MENLRIIPSVTYELLSPRDFPAEKTTEPGGKAPALFVGAGQREHGASWSLHTQAAPALVPYALKFLLRIFRLKPRFMQDGVDRGLGEAVHVCEESRA